MIILCQKMIESTLTHKGPEMNKVRITLAIAAVFLAATARPVYAATDNADTVLKNVEKKLHAQDESAHV